MNMNIIQKSTTNTTFSNPFLGGHEYQVQVKSRSLASHYLGEESEAKNIELFAEYNVNGIPGYGIVEWNYRNLKSIK